MTLNYIDFIFIAFFVMAAIWGVWKGFVRQLFGLVALFLGVFCAYHFSDFAATWITKWIHQEETVIAVIAFAVTFLAVLFGVILAGRITEKIVKTILLGWFNRIAGLLFSIAKMAFILSICIYLLLAFDQLWPFFPHQDGEKSILFAPIAKLAPALFPYLKNLIATI